MVLVRTAHGWHEHTSPLSETTMTPADFPLPLLAPEVVAFVGCEAVKLRLPVLRYCVTRTHTEKKSLNWGVVQIYRLYLPLHHGV